MSGQPEQKTPLFARKWTRTAEPSYADEIRGDIQRLLSKLKSVRSADGGIILLIAGIGKMPV